MNAKVNRKCWAQLVVVLFCAATVKFYYSTASVNQLRWILAPTTSLVEIVSGTSFEFESYAGYISSDRSFMIAASCAGVNFLIMSFLMLSIKHVWRNRSRSISWKFIPAVVVLAYLSTLVANTLRISTALLLKKVPLEISWLSANQLHRFEGILIYFGFLLVLFIVSEKMSERNDVGRELMRSSSGDAPSLAHRPSVLKQSLFPLLVYYASAFGIPLINGAYRQGSFWEHSLFVLLTPLLVMLPIFAFQFLKDGSAACSGPSSTGSRFVKRFSVHQTSSRFIKHVSPFNKPAKQVKA